MVHRFATSTIILRKFKLAPHLSDKRTQVHDLQAQSAVRHNLPLGLDRSGLAGSTVRMRFDLHLRLPVVGGVAGHCKKRATISGTSSQL